MASPPPLTAADADLRVLPKVPFDVDWVQDGWLSMTLSDQAFRAAILLYAEAWHQVPAASLPDDDRVLCVLSGLTYRRWRRVRAVVLQDWILCADGRFYHPLLAESANSAWLKVQAVRRRFNRRVELFSDEWSAIRLAVFKRDRFTCTYCNASGVPLQCDHIVPVRKGGKSVWENLTTACAPCNRSKGAKLLSEWVR